jgi:ribosomal protein S18 acetylase RimI-like enzyme
MPTLRTVTGLPHPAVQSLNHQRGLEYSRFGKSLDGQEFPSGEYCRLRSVSGQHAPDMPDVVAESGYPVVPKMSIEDPDLVTSDTATIEDLQFLEDQVNEFNFATTGIRDARLLVFLLRDSGGRISAGLSGHTWGGVAEIRFLWVDESRRHGGVGSRLLQAAEQEARARRCKKIVLSTHSFQAPDFYRRHGYVVAGEYRDYPVGHRSIFLEKTL